MFFDGDGWRRSCNNRANSRGRQQHGLNTLEHQPVKVMAMEGHFKAIRWCTADPCLTCPVTEAAGEIKYSIERFQTHADPETTSLDDDAPLQGLVVPRTDWPNVGICWAIPSWSASATTVLGLGLF
jgi:cytochrome d ubiquinol oxidase subunit I